MNCHIDFSVGSSRIETGLGGNASEIGRIEATLRTLLTDDSFVMDSIMIIASASPEGSLKSNLALSFSRARSVSEFFSARVDRLKDSLRREAGVFMSLGPTRKTADAVSGCRKSSSPRRAAARTGSSSTGWLRRIRCSRRKTSGPISSWREKSTSTGARGGWPRSKDTHVSGRNCIRS